MNASAPSLSAFFFSSASLRPATRPGTPSRKATASSNPASAAATAASFTVDSPPGLRAA
eukprot:CAMPEP_0197409420 /NCGR_PEP_ID=MMETSP1165-20131217/29866_1 /TAXON_ID=284809 /ORGANISM="Chrysocystis fragilis, Strain CCMP3189" /LENGTH=58 /DNA_ID=CAMNT_0042935881 /DNA_START=40 /DNA_END=212 /DNA_ORIENTATION=+